MGDSRAVLKTIQRFAEQEQASETIKIEEARLQQAVARQLSERAAQNGTNKLGKAERDALPMLNLSPYGLDTQRPAHLITLPQDPSQHRDICWMIELQGLGAQHGSLSIELMGDVVVGINRPGQQSPDLDLSAYQAEDKGVSRRHACLRPTRNRLYLLDLQSTNGTRLNALPVGAGVAKELRNNDTISLGAFTFTIKIIASPEMME